MDGLPTITFIAAILIYIYWVIRSVYSWIELIPTAEPSVPDLRWPSVSVIVPLRNEEEHLSRLIEELVDQDYPEERYEILLVDDHSDRPVQGMISGSIEEEPLLRVMELPAGTEGKKSALSEGIRRAEGDWIVTTDGDTRRGRFWLRALIGKALSDPLRAVAGPVMIHPVRGWTGWFEYLEQAVLTSLSAGGIKSGNFPLCSGANLAFEKSFFEQVQGYEGNDRIASGDDVFLMQKFLNTEGSACGYVPSGISVVYTSSGMRYEDYIGQRARWSGKNRALGHWRLIAEGVMPYFGNVLVLLGLILWMAGILSGPLFWIAFAAKSGLEIFWVRLVEGSLETEGMPVSRLLPAAVLYPFFSVVSMFWILLARKKVQYWKGRRIRSS